MINKINNNGLYTFFVSSNSNHLILKQLEKTNDDNNFIIKFKASPIISIPNMSDKEILKQFSNSIEYIQKELIKLKNEMKL